MDSESKEFPTPIKEFVAGETRIEQFPRVSRRGFLKSFSALTAAYLLKPEIAEREQEETRYDLIRKRIFTSEGDPGLKINFVERIDKIEKTQQVMDQFMRAYQEFKDRQGNPLLKTLYEKKYADLPLPIEEKIFFLRDGAVLQTANKNIDMLLSDESWRSIDEIKYYLDRLTFFFGPTPSPDAEVELRRLSTDYTEIGNERPEKGLEIISRVEPETPEGKRLFEEDKKFFQAIFKNLPRVRNLRVELYNPNRYGYKEEENPRRNDGYFFPDEQQDHVGIKVETSGISDRTLYVAHHEWGHTLNILANVFLRRNLSPRQIVELMILLEKVQQSEYGRNYPFAKKIFDTETRIWSNRSPVTPEDFRFLTGHYPDDIWATLRGPESAPHSQPVGDVYYHSAWVAQALGLSDFRPFLGIESIPTTPNEGEKIFSSLPEFLEQHRSKVNSVVKEFAEWRIVFELLEENKNLWVGDPRTDYNIWFSRVSPGRGTESEWWGYIFSVCTNIVLTNAFYSNDRKVIQNFRNDKLITTYYNMKWVFDIADSEKWAESISYMILMGKEGKLAVTEVPYLDYLVKLRSFGAVERPRRDRKERRIRME